MSDNERNEVSNPTRVDGGNTPTTIRITISFDPESGNVGLTGPVNNPILLLGMLKLAEKTYDAMRLRSQMEQAKSTTPRIHRV